MEDLSQRLVTVTIEGLKSPEYITDYSLSADIPEDYKIKEFVTDSVREKLFEYDFLVMFDGAIITDDDSPKTLNMKNSGLVYIITEVDLSNPEKNKNLQRTEEVYIVYKSPPKTPNHNIGTEWCAFKRSFDLGITVKQLKKKLMLKDVWMTTAIVHNRTLMDDHDTLEGAGVSPRDLIGLVSLNRLLEGTEKQVKSQTDMVVQSQTFDQKVYEKYSTIYPGFSSLLDYKGENLRTELYIGPQRDHCKERRVFPGVRLAGFKKKARVQDLIDLYNSRPGYHNVKELRFNNETLKGDELVHDVLKCGMNRLEYFPFEKFFTFVKISKDAGNQLARSIDDMVRNIEETHEKQGNKKKQNKKSKNVKRIDVEPKVVEQTHEIHLAKVDMEIKADKPATIISKLKNVKEREMVSQEKLQLEAEIESKQLMLKQIKINLEEKSGDVKKLLVKIEETENDNLFHQKKIGGLNLKISDLEVMLENAKREKAESKKKVEINNQCIANLSEKKLKLDKYIDDEVQKSAEKATLIKAELVLLEERILKNLNNLKNKEEDDKRKVVPSSEYPMDPKKHFLNFLIQQREKDLECPVCLVPATVPIFSCSESHLICSKCRNNVTECPECRLVYKDKQPTRRHRYAERMLEELLMLKRELMQPVEYV